MTQPASTRGAIDADGHILEPPDLWEKYLEPKYRDRAIRIRTNAEGLEYMEFNGRPSRLMPPGFPGSLGGMGASDIRPSPERTYMKTAPFGSMDPKERIQRLDREGLSKAVLYPTLGILWEPEIRDAELGSAYARAYNRWIQDFCSDSGGRLVPIAHISLTDAGLAAQETERAIKAGAKGIFVHPFTWTRKSPGHPDYDRVWAIAQEAGTPVALHPTVDPPSLDVHRRFDELATGEPFVFTWYFDVLVAQGMQQAFVSLFHHRVFERFPTVKVVVLESQAGWIGQLIDRMDAVSKGPLMPPSGLKELPSFYFKRQCYISIDPDERAVAKIIPYIGEDKFFWASDFPHPDHTSDYLHELGELLAPLPEGTRRKVLWENVTRAYNLQ
ncbi:MAG: amidohydrolase [Nevskia sp.]|nr:amidohydrolase [Nevskia sp.]